MTFSYFEFNLIWVEYSTNFSFLLGLDGFLRIGFGLPTAVLFQPRDQCNQKLQPCRSCKTQYLEITTSKHGKNIWKMNVYQWRNRKNRGKKKNSRDQLKTNWKKMKVLSRNEWMDRERFVLMEIGLTRSYVNLIIIAPSPLKRTPRRKQTEPQPKRPRTNESSAALELAGLGFLGLAFLAFI